MDDERAIVETSMKMLRQMRVGKDDAAALALARYLEIIPESLLQGMAHHKARLYLKERPQGPPLSNFEIVVLSAQLCQQILNELIQKARRRQGTVINGDLDGAELFYRRALNHIGMERYVDAERLLRRSVEIYPDFLDGWDVLSEVLEHNGKVELAEQARLKVLELKTEV
jgi:hypothetical protein